MKIQLFFPFCLALLLSNLLSAQPKGIFQIEIDSPDSSELGTCMMLDENSDAYLAAIVWHTVLKRSYMKLFKIKQDGKIAWTKEFPGRSIIIFSIIKENDGSLIMAGEIQDSLGHDLPEVNSILMKTDSLGNIIWEKFFKLADRGNLNGIYKSHDGYLLKGYGISNDRAKSSRLSAYIIKTDFEGNKVWEHTFDKPVKNYNDYIITPKKNGTFFCVVENNSTNKKHPTLIFTLASVGDVFGQMEIQETGIGSVVENEKGEMVFFQTLELTGDSNKVSYLVSAKKLVKDSLITIKNISEGRLIDVLNVELLDGFYYIPASLNGKAIFIKASEDFSSVEKMELSLPQNIAFDGFCFGKKGEIMIAGVQESPLKPEFAKQTKAKINAGIFLWKGMFSDLLKK